ncbi:MAG TPA: fumarylacetoacetate hydrolase family protein [Patescibacteria group bacterium]|nr:fumarylacetoacetate hydrolase family protein [Patescibacteria group bacterium]
MKFITFTCGGSERLGILKGNYAIDLQLAFKKANPTTDFELSYMPDNILDFLKLGQAGIRDVEKIDKWLEDNGQPDEIIVHSINAVTLVSPVPRPTSMRDGYAFRQHVESARRNRGLEMIPEFDEIPIFYFTNHQAVTGPGEVLVQPMHMDQLDFELECAIVIGKEGRNIPASKADEYIFGYTIMNDWSARAMQMHEMKLNLGPAKGKDFATSLGPFLATKDELAEKRIEGENGERYDLTMVTRLNGQEVSRGNTKDMSWTFAQIIERASYGVTLYPGDVIGSGTVGTGCFLELNGSKVFNPPLWVKDGDVVECEIDLLGNLVNRIKLEK